MKDQADSTVVVSVILPTFNRAHCIKRAIESIYDQTFKSIELIIIDDCSNDNTVEVVEAYIRNAPIKSRCFRLNENVGPAAARNAGIAIATGKYITFIDSDSAYRRNKVQVQVEILDESPLDVGACFCRFENIKDGCSSIVPKDESKYLHENLLSLLFWGNVIGTPSIMVKRSILDLVGTFDTTLRCVEDWDFAIRIARQYRILFIDAVLFDDFYSANSVNLRGDLRIEARKKIIDKNLDFYWVNPDAVAFQLKLIAFDLIRGGQTKTAQVYLRKAYKIAPKYKKKSKYLLLFWMSQLGVIRFVRD